MDRKLDGMFFRVKRDGKWENVCISDMTDEEMETAVFKYHHAKYFKQVIKNLAHSLKELGDQFDLVRE